MIKLNIYYKLIYSYNTENQKGTTTLDLIL
jgi:hypothetical protein